MTKQIVTQSRLKELFSYSPDTGSLVWIKKSHEQSYRSIIGKEAGWGLKLQGKPYRMVEVDGKTHLIHRLVWLFFYGEWPNNIDHINGDGTDNRIKNLRSVNHQENMKNKKKYINNKTGYTGVGYRSDRNKFTAFISHANKRKHLGYFIEVWDAICARKSAEYSCGFHKNNGN